MNTMSRTWAMPNKHTFKIKPALEVIKKHLNADKLWIDPFSGFNSPCKETNDLNPNAPTKYHMEAADFVKQYNNIDGIVFDPPYSPHQLVTSYKDSGIDNTKYKGMNAMLYSEVKDAASERMKKGAIAITYGWNSNGFGKNRGFELLELHLIAHGGAHNDTIITVERKL